MLTTERLILRKHQADDMQWLSKLYTDDKVMFYLPSMYTTDEALVQEKLTRLIEEETEDNRKHYFYCIIKKETQSPIGEIGFTIVEDTKEIVADIGYFIFHEHWNQGYITEAMKAMMNFAFRNVYIDKIVAGCFQDNVASEKVLIKSGMTKVEEITYTKLLRGKEKQRVKYEITREQLNF